MKRYRNPNLDTLYCHCCCCSGPAGADGKSAYQIALEHGFIGSETEWLASLKGEPGDPGPFLSSYIEAVGNTQDISNGGDAVFSTDPDELDMVGSYITLDATGSVFTINHAGLYRVEWSMNLSSAANPVVVGLMENGSPVSALSSNMTSGNHSSGALINVSENDVPYTVTLRNFGAPISIANPLIAENTAVSFRISRFADGPA